MMYFSVLFCLFVFVGAGEAVEAVAEGSGINSKFHDDNNEEWVEEQATLEDAGSGKEDDQDETNVASVKSLYPVTENKITKDRSHPCVPNPCPDPSDRCKVIKLHEMTYTCGVKTTVAPPVTMTSTVSQHDPCHPNPCQGDCDCVESCKHEFGYYCKSRNSKWIGKNCTIPIPKVSCPRNGMEVEVSSSILREYDQGLGNTYFVITSVRSEGPSPRASDECKATQSGANYIVRIDLDNNDCGIAARQSSGGKNIATGVLWMGKENLRSLEVPIKVARLVCKYSYRYDVTTSLQPTIELPAIVHMQGQFQIDISLCKVPACASACPAHLAVNRGATYTVGETIHVTTSTRDNGDFGLSLATHEMFVACKSSGVGDHEKLQIVENWCDTSRNLAVKMGVSDASRSCVSFQVPRATCNEIFIFAKVKLCRSIVAKTCPGSGARSCTENRRRRSFSDDEGVAVIGPINIVMTREMGEVRVLLPMEKGNSTIQSASEQKQRRSRFIPIMIATIAFSGTLIATVLLFSLFKVIASCRYSSL